MNRLWWMRGPLFEEAGDGGEGGGGGVDAGTPPPDTNAQLTQQLREQKQELDRLKTLVSSNVQRPPQQSQQPAQPQGPDKSEIEKSFWKNPLDVTNALAQRQAFEVSQQVVQNMMGGSMDTLARVARDQARAQDPEIFDQLEPEIEAKMAQLTPNFRTNATAWINALNMAKGENFRKLKADVSKNRAPAVHTSSTAQPTTPASPAPKAPELTPEERTFAKKFKMSEADYAHGKELLADSDNAFNQVVTFDSFEAKLRKQQQKGKAA